MPLSKFYILEGRSQTFLSYYKLRLFYEDQKKDLKWMKYEELAKISKNK